MMPACLYETLAHRRTKMAANVRTEMRIPTRAAPRPPGESVAQRNTAWNSSSDLFGSSFTSQPPVQKKKPPPRPPPPKFAQNQNQHQRGEKPKRPARPTELLTNLFGRKPTKQQHTNVAFSVNRPPSSASQSSATPNGIVSLIDLSPPGSPTFTTRSSSDGVSVDSFGSDGNSNPSVFTNSGNTSQTESAFEDDFDFFGGLSSGKIAQNDPWKITPSQDPFAPLPNNHSSSTSNFTKQVGNTSFFAFNNDNAMENQVPLNQSVPNAAPIMPTIIRARPAKPPAPKTLQKSLAPTVAQFSAKPTPAPRSAIPLSEPVTLDVNNAWPDDFGDDPSPPMPSIPPPAPPPEYLAELDEGITGNCQEPYGIALYNFPVSQPDDLPLAEGDVVILVKAVNEDWLEGRVGDRQGMFPANFVDIKVPLPGLPTNTANALYTFKGEAWEDLAFEEGAKITVLSRISAEWLYGECGGKRGQFPANYIDRVPSNLPQYS